MCIKGTKRFLRKKEERSFSGYKNYSVLAFSLFLSLFLGTHLSIFAASPTIINHQGRLMDASGELLGDAGTNYCFRFSFYGDATVGAPDTELWPGGPSTMTVNVEEGVYNVGIGSGADTLDFDFNSTDEVYLNIEVAESVGGSCAGVASFETLEPRQRINSSGYAINANTLLGFTPSQTPGADEVVVLDGSGDLNLAGVADVGGITINSDAFTDLTGSGLGISAGVLNLNLTTSGTTGSTTSNSGLEVSASGLTLLKGCTDNHILKYTDAGGWTCSPDLTGGGGVSFGTDNQVPFSNAGGTDFDYSASLTFDGTILSVPTLTLTGTGTINGLDAIDATTESFLEGALDIGGDGTGTVSALVVTDDSHAHTTTTISGLDISADTNLTAGTNITLTGDDLSVDDVFLLNTGDTATGTYDFTGAEIAGTSALVFEGSASDTIETIFSITNPTTGDKTITFPDATITVNAAGDISGTTLASNVVTSSLTTVGALGSGSITSGFGAIDVGTDTITTTGLVTSGAFTGTGDITINDASADTILIGQSGATDDTVTIAGNISLTDDQWSISATGVATGITGITADSVVFTNVTAGTNANALVVGTGGSLTTSGSGTITATDLVCTNCIGATEIVDLALGTDTFGNYVLDVVAGAGLTGDTAGEGATATLAVGAGTAITVNANDIAVTADAIGDTQLTFNTGQHLTTSSSPTFGALIVGGTDNLSISTDGDITFVDANGAASITGPAGGALSLLAGASQGLTITGNAASTWSTSSGDLTLGAGGAGTANVIIGGAASATPDLLVLGRKSDAGDPSVVDGAIYYNDNSDKFYIAEGGAWKEVCNKADAACGAGSGSAWSALTVPTGNLTLAMDADTTTFNYTNTGALNAFSFTLNNNAGLATTQNLLNLSNAVSTQTTDVNTEALLLLNNADTSGTGSTIVDNAILITNTGGITSGIIDALDASATEIDNALNIGANAIAGTNFSVTGAGAIVGVTLDTGQGANELFDMDQNVLQASNVTFANVTDSALTSGRVTFAGASGLLSDDAGLTYNAGTDTLTAGTFVGALTGSATDLNCTDCINATEIEDIFLLNTGDTSTGALTINDNNGGASTLLTIGDANDADSLAIFGDLTVTGGDITLGTTSIFSGGDTASLNNIDAIDATTETTLEAALDIAGDVTGTGLSAVVIADNAVDGTDIALGSDAQGDVMYYDGTNWVRLAAGVSGQFLKTQGAAANPVWDTATVTWDAIGDAATDGSITLGAHETDFTSTIDAAGEAVWTITNTDADTTNDSDFISLAHNDGADANVFYFRAVGDLDGTPQTDYRFSQTGALIRPDLTVTGTIATTGGLTIDATTESNIEAALDTLSSVTTVGALNAGSITSGFGAIDLGTDNFTTTGIVSTDTLTLTNTGTLNGLDVIDATGEATLEAALDIAGDVTGTGLSAVVIADNAVDGTDIALGSDAQGDVMYYDGTNWARLAAGVSGQFLKTQGAAANPVWDTATVTWDAIGDAATDGSIEFASTEQLMNWTDFTDTDFDGITFNFDNHGGTAGNDYGMVLNNAVTTNAAGDVDTEAILLIQQLDTTASGTTDVDNLIKLDIVANAGATDGIEITNSGGNLTNGINIVDTAGGTLTTGILMSGTFTNLLDTPTVDISNAGAITGVTALTVDNLNLDLNTISSTSGAINLTPLSGQSLNVTLGTTGDLIVNTNDLVVDTSAGFVGVGTAAPETALQILNGDFSIQTTTGIEANYQIRDDDVAHPFTGIGGVFSTITTETSMALAQNNTTAGGAVFAGFRDTAANAVTIQGHSNGDSTTSAAVTLVGYNTDGGTGRAALGATAKVLEILTATTPLMTFLGSGNVGVGDTSPDAMFTVGSTSQFQVNSSGAIAAVTGYTQASGDFNVSLTDASSANIDGDGSPTADIFKVGVGDTTASAIDGIEIVLTTSEGSSGTNLLNLTPTFASTTNSSTHHALNIANITATSTTNNLIARGINIGTMTEAGTGTVASTIFSSGTGWDNIFDTAGFDVVNTTGATTIAGSAEGTAALTLALGDIVLTDGDITLTSGQIEVPDNTASFALIEDAGGGADYLALVTTDGSETMVFGHGTVDSVTFTTDGTGTAEIALPAGSIDGTEILDATVALGDLATQGTATDEYCLTSETGGGALLAWQDCASGVTLQTAYVGGATIDITSGEGALDIDAQSANVDFEIGQGTDTGDFRIWDGTDNWLFIDESADTLTLGAAASQINIDPFLAINNTIEITHVDSENMLIANSNLENRGLDINYGTVADGATGLFIDLLNNEGAGASIVYGAIVNINNDATTNDDTVFGLYLDSVNSGDSDADKVADALLAIDNSDTNNPVIDGIRFIDAGGGFTDYIDTPTINITGAGAITGATGLTSTGTVDFYDVGTLLVPVSDAPSVDSQGELSLDANFWGAAGDGAVLVDTGNNTVALVGILSSDTCTNNQIPKFNDTTDEWTCEDDSTGTSTLQQAYDAGNTITTDATGDVTFTLADLGTSTRVEIFNQDIDATEALEIDNTIASGTLTNGLLLEQSGAGTMTNAIHVLGTAGTIANGLLIADGAGAITDAIELTGTFTNLLNTPTVDISNAGAITGATGLTSTGTVSGDTVVANTNFTPDANDGAALGTAALQFSDLFLAEGGVVNWDNGDVTLTQTGDNLTLATGGAEGTSALTFTTGDITLTDGDIVLTSGDFEIPDNSADAFTMEDATSGADYLQIVTTDGAETMTFGHGTVDSVTFTTDNNAAGDVAITGGLTVTSGATHDSFTITSSADTEDAEVITVANTTGSAIDITDSTADTASADGMIFLKSTDATPTQQQYLIQGRYTANGDTDNDFLLFEDNAGTDQFIIGQDGDVFITGVADGTNALTLTAGDIEVTNGDLDVLDGDFNVDLDTADGVNITNSGSPSVDMLTVVNGTATTTNGVDALQITFDSANASGNAIDITLNGITGNGSDTTIAIDVDAFSYTSSAGTDIVQGLNIGNLTESGSITSSAINIGTGWDNIIDSVDFDVNADGLITLASDGAGDQITATAGNADYQFLVLDNVTVDNTTTEGVIDLNIDAGNANGVKGLNIDLVQVDGVAAGFDAEAMRITLQQEDANADMFGITINALSHTEALAGSYEYGIGIYNSDDTIASMTDAIFIQSAGVDGGIVDAIDVSNSGITNAINIGNNPIVTGNVGGIIGDATTDSWTFTTDGTGTAEVVLPDGSISTAEILDDTLTASDLAAILTFADADLINMAGVNVTSATEGLILPQHATDCTTATAEGQICWEVDGEDLYIGNGTTAIQMNGGGGGTLQTAYDAGNTITTDATGDVTFTLADLATSTRVEIFNQDIDATEALEIDNTIASGTLTNGLLLEQSGAGTMTNAIQVLGTAGTITNGLLIADGAGAITTGISFTGTLTTGINFDGGDFTRELVLENGEAIINQTDDTVVIEDDGGTDYLTITGGTLGVATTPPTTVSSADAGLFFGAGGSLQYRTSGVTQVNLGRGVYFDTTANGYKYLTSDFGVLFQFDQAGNYTVWTAPSGTAGATPTLTNRFTVLNTGNVGVGGDSSPDDLFSVGSSSQFQVNSSGQIDTIAGYTQATGDFNVSLTDASSANIDGDGSPTADIFKVGVGDTTASAIDGIEIVLTTSEGSSGTNLLNLTPTFASTTNSSTHHALNIANITATSTTNNLIARGINIGTMTEAGTGTVASTIFSSGTGWDNIFDTAGFDVVNTTGATTIAGSAEGTAALTLALGDIVLTDGDIVLTSGDFEIPDNSADAFTMEDATNGLDYLQIVTTDGSETMVLGHGTVDSVTFTTDGTGTAEVVLPDGSISTAEILDDTLTASDLAATLTFADADLINMAGVNVTSATEGLILPQHATDCTTATAEGQICWEVDGEDLYVGNGTTAIQMNGGGGGIATIEEDNSTVTSSATIIDFLGSDFNVTGASGEGDIAIDYANSEITRNNQSETIVNDWTWSIAEAEDLALDWSVSGTQAGQAEAISITNSTSSGNQYGLAITNADSSGVSEAGILVDNVDTSAGSLADGIRITSTGVNTGVTDGIDVSASALTNAINIGSNRIEGSVFDVESSGDVTALSYSASGGGYFDGSNLTFDAGANIYALGGDLVMGALGGDVEISLADTSQLRVYPIAASTLDVVSVSNSGFASATTGADALSIVWAAADGADLVNSGVNILLTGNGTAATDIMRGLFIDLAAATTAASMNKAIEIGGTDPWDIDIELQNDESISNVTNGTIDITATTTDLSGALVAGSGNTAVTLSTGMIDADAITLTSSGTAGAVNSSSGLQVVSDGLTLLKGCADGDVMQWDDGNSYWECDTDNTSAGAGVATVQEEDANVTTATTTLDFEGGDFIITSEDAGAEAKIDIDYANSEITRNNQSETIVNDWTWTLAEAEDLALNWSVSGTQAGQAEAISITNSSSSGSQYGLSILNSDGNTGITEAGILINNAEDSAGSLADGILITSTGTNNGVTDGIDVSATEINNAINIGANTILGTAAVIDFTDFDVSATGGLTMNDILTVNDDVTVALTGDENLEITDGATPTIDIISIIADGASVTTDANALEIDFTTGDGASVTNSGLKIDMASGGTAAGDITDAIRITMDAADASTQNGLFIGANFDNDINFNDATPTITLSATDNTAVFKIVDSNATPQTLFEVRDYATNVGSLATAGGFLGTMSYFSEEFNDDGTAGLTADNALQIGDKGATAGGDWYFDTTGTTVTYTEQDNVGGFARLATGTTSGVGGLIGYGSAQNNLSLIFSKANLPVLQMKIRVGSTATTNDVLWGFVGTVGAAALATNDPLPAEGIFFWGNNGTSWVGVVRSGSANVGTVTCSGSISTTQFAVGRIQVESATSVRFLIDNDASDGVQFSDCGTVSGANPTAALGVIFTAVNTTTSSVNNDIDYVRVWQDDTGDASDSAGNEAPIVVNTPEANPQAILADMMTVGENVQYDIGHQVDAEVLAVSKGIIVPELFADRIKTNTITTSTGSDINVILGEEGKFTLGGETVTENEDGTTVTTPAPVITFDSQGNATFAGEVTAKKFKLAEIDGITEMADEIALLANGQEALTLTVAAVEALSNSLNTVSNGVLLLQEKDAQLETRIANIETALTTGIFEDENGLVTLDKLLVTGEANFEGQTEFAGLAFFNADTTFAKNVLFMEGVEFTLPPIFNADTAGFALIKKDANRVEVVFDTEYATTPVVNTTMSFEEEDNIDEAEVAELFAAGIQNLVVNKSTKGFTILLNKNAPRDVRFSWSALAVKDAKIFESIMSGLVIEEETPVEETIIPSEPAPESELVPLVEETVIEVVPEPVPEEIEEASSAEEVLAEDPIIEESKSVPELVPENSSTE